MADKTTYLQLNKPGANASGWGSALNNNMDILDNAYNSTNSRINNLQLQLGEMNYISFMPNQDYVKFNTGPSPDTSYFTVGAVNRDGDDLEVGTTKKYGVNNDPYSEIEDFTGFYVLTSSPARKNAPAPYNIEWKAGDILVKNSIVEGNQRIPQFIKFPQALGGYYVPTGKTIGPSTQVTFTKTLSLAAEDSYTITFPSGTVQASWKNVELYDNDDIKQIGSTYEYTYTIPELHGTISGTYIPPLDLRFFQVESGKIQRVEIDYWFTNTITDCTLHFELNKALDTTLYLSYIIYTVR